MNFRTFTLPDLSWTQVFVVGCILAMLMLFVVTLLGE